MTRTVPITAVDGDSGVAQIADSDSQTPFHAAGGLPAYTASDDAASPVGHPALHFTLQSEQAAFEASVYRPIGVADAFPAASAGNPVAAPMLPILAPAATFGGTAGNDFIHVAGDGLIAPGGYTDNTSATSGDDVIDISQGGTDQVFAGAGNDSVSLGAGLTGADHIDGGDDFDTAFLAGDYTGGNALTLSSATLANFEIVRLGAGHNYSLAMDDTMVAAGHQMLVTAEAVTASNNSLVFDASAETDGSYEVIGSWGSDQITGGAGNDTIFGNGGNDVLNGDGGDDILFGASSGNVTVNGGSGSDTASFSGLGGGVTLDLSNAGAQAITYLGGTVTLVGIENLFGTGNADHLTGDGNDNVLNGSLGDDVLDGAGGNDTASYDQGYAVNVDLSIVGAQDTGQNGTDTLISIENLFGSFDADVLKGNAGDNVLSGSGGDDTLFASLGNDTLDGGAGSDTVSYANLGAGVTIDLRVAGAQAKAAGGTDTLVGIENLTGTDFADMLTGDGNANTLSGGDGADILIGGAGNDILNGGGGDDILYAGSGNDAVDGGAGFDTLNYNSDTAGFTANIGAGTLSGTGTGNDTIAGIEEILGGSGNDNLTGGTGDDRLYGNGGTNTLSGGGGNDALYDTGSGGSFDGGSGSDYLMLDRSALGAQSAVFNSGSAVATVLSDGTSFANIETLYLATGGGDDSITFNQPLQHPVGSSAGPSTWDAGAGTDSFTVNLSSYDTAIIATSGGDYYNVYENGGTVAAAHLAETFHITGGAGDDLFSGEAGNDSFDGGAGLDTAQYLTAAHSDFAVSYDAGTQSFTFADQRGGAPEGSDTFKNVEQFQFSDGVFTYDTQGRVTSQAVGDGGGNTTVTATDVAGTAAWDSQVTFYAQGSLKSQTVTNDNGTHWVNTYDPANSQAWSWTSDGYDGNGQHVTQVGTNDDGSHWLTLLDAANAYSFADVTLTFDANWTQTGLSGTNDDNSHTVSMAKIAPALDAALWFATPYDANFDAAPVDTNLVGGAGIDVLYGFAGNNILEGGGGNDTLIGGAGFDVLSGGAGDDRFVFRTGDGIDVIKDFAPGGASNDVIDLHGYGVTTFIALLSHMTQIGPDTLIVFDDQNVIDLHNVAMVQLNSGDFVLS